MSGEADHVCAFSVELLGLCVAGGSTQRQQNETLSITDKELPELRDQASMEPIQKMWPGHGDLLMSN